MPSFFNGVFGHKPSKFVVSNNGQYPAPITTEQTSFLGIGPICRRAEDLLPLLKVIAGKNAPELRLDEPVDIKQVQFYYQDCDMGSVGVSPVHHEIKELFGKISLHLEKAHGIKTKKVAIQRFRKSGPIWFANMKTPNGPSFQEQLANLEGSINPYVELVKWCFRRSDHTFIGIVTALADKGGCKYGDDKHTYLVEERGKLRRDMEDLLGDDGVFLYPTHPEQRGAAYRDPGGGQNQERPTVSGRGQGAGKGVRGMGAPLGRGLIDQDTNLPYLTDFLAQLFFYHCNKQVWARTCMCARPTNLCIIILFNVNLVFDV
jgi:Asp-tRNA(Asn)/Glu-tRNA(Gln) amidotransferase A subunit family amidase